MAESYVYAISDGVNIKIGVARHPQKRIKQLQTGNAVKITMLGYFSGGFSLEKEIHNKHQKVRENGEWLYATTELIDYLNTMILDKYIMKDGNSVKAFPKIKN